MSSVEREILEAIAERRHLTMSDCIRLLIHEERIREDSRKVGKATSEAR